MLIATSLIGVFPATAANQPTDKYTAFMENVLSVDIAKYDIELTSNFTNDILGRKITYMRYELISEQSNLGIIFSIEKGIITSCSVSLLDGKVLTTKQYSSQLAAVEGFLEKYQAYSEIDSNNLIAMLHNVDITKNSTITMENMKLTITNIFVGEISQTSLLWTQVANGADYNLFDVTFDKEKNFVTMGESRGVFIIGDTSVNISEAQAIDIALENLQFYSYEMPDGSVVKDFKVSRDAVVATLATYSGAYELRPYWDIRMFLDEVAPGNVLGITAFIWANTGEIIEYGNMATGGTYYPDNTIDNTNPTDNAIVSTPNSNVLIIGVTVGVIKAIIATSILVAKKKQK